jgi:phosphopantetheinyl transferase (holo-ACP synthase)
MFHGPAYRGVVALGPVGKDGIRGVLESGAATGALLDNAGQLFGYWVMIANDVDRMAMPVAIARLELFGPPPPVGERLDCTVRVRRHEARAVVADLALGRAGSTWCRIEGWEDRRFTTDERLWRVMRFPEDNMLSERRPGGWVWLADTYRAAPTRDQLMRRFLGERERAEYEAQPPLSQRAWLAGRIAAKDAARDLLWRSGHGKLFPVEIELETEATGRTVARLAGAGRASLRVSLSHLGEVAVALACPGGDGSPGIDVEAIAPRDAAAALTEEELALVGADDRDEWVARLLAAKRAAGRARGAASDDDLRRTRIADRTGERVLVDGSWVDTRREGGHVVAWTLSER